MSIPRVLALAVAAALLVSSLARVRADQPVPTATPPAAPASTRPASPPQNPFAPELTTALAPADAWLNTDRPLRLSDELKGHVVLLDFWTHCCINCLHILPDLAWLEEKYADEPFVVIGVHSAKFDSEGDRASIRNAIFRNNIRHPVLIDTGMTLWTHYGVRSWPTFVLIGPDGRLIGFTSGEGKREVLDQVIGQSLDAAREAGTLAQRRVRITPDAAPRAVSGLSYPGNVLAISPDPAHNIPGYLAVSDTAHNRVVIANWPDAAGHASLFGLYGSGLPGLTDAWATEAAFHDPQGLAFDPALGSMGTLYVADTSNHAVRCIDLATGLVSTIAGTGAQSGDRDGGAPGREQALSSPWDLALSPDANTLYVAMAGTHQLWSIDLADSARAVSIAGGMGENIIDGPARLAMLAQPSGLALSADGRRLYFADSEVSAIRFLDLQSSQIVTILGSGLFEFGDVDGAFPDVRLQHCIGLSLMPSSTGEQLLVADTYNDKIKLVNPGPRTSRTFLGIPRGQTSDAGTLDLSEPAGLSYVAAAPDRPARLFIADTNNHRIVMVDPATGAHTEVFIDPLTPPASATQPGTAQSPDPALAAISADVSLAPDQPATLTLSPTLPLDATINTEAPITVRLWRLPREGDRMMPTVILQSTLAANTPISITLPQSEVRADALLLVELSFSWCTHGTDATCRPGNLAWRVTLHAGQASEATLTASVD